MNDKSPFLGVYTNKNGDTIDMLSNTTVSPKDIVPNATPFYGRFLDKDGIEHDISELSSGGGGGGIPDAPVDGKLYGREDGAWAEVPESVPPTQAWYIGKNLLVFGDSIANQFDVPLGVQIQAITNKNMAKGGATLTDKPGTVHDGSFGSDAQNTWSNQLINLLNQVTAGTYSVVPDIIVISFGANDRYLAEPTLDNEKEFTDETGIPIPIADLNLVKNISASLRWGVEQLRIQYPQAKIFICAPIQRANTAISTSFCSFIKDEIKKATGMLAVNFVNSYENSEIYAGLEPGRYLGDGLHPNAEGLVLLINTIVKAFDNANGTNENIYSQELVAGAMVRGIEPGQALSVSSEGKLVGKSISEFYDYVMEETIIPGRWISGQARYQKILIFPTGPAANGNVSIPHGIQNLDMILDFEISSSPIYAPMFLSPVLSGDNIVLYNGSSQDASSTGIWLTLRYIKQGAVVLHNLIINGDFSQGIAGWSKNDSPVISSLTVDAEDQALTFIVTDPTTTRGNIAIRRNNSSFINPSFEVGHILYARCSAMLSGVVNGDPYGAFRQIIFSFSLQNTATTSSPPLTVSKNYAAVDVFSDYSFHGPIISDGFNNLTIYYGYTRSDNAFPTLGSTTKLKNVMVIDLTADYGVGKEPTKEWCDANIPWFDGTLTL